MDRKEYELILGITCLLISLIWGYYEIKSWNETEEDDYMTKSYSIEIIGGLIAFFVIGIIGIYRYFS